MIIYRITWLSLVCVAAVWVYPVLDTHTSSDKKLSYAGLSQYELRQEYSFLLFSKAFIAL